MRQNETLTPQQDKAINLLLMGKSVKGVAQELKIARATLNRWLNHSIFKGEFEQRQREINQSVKNKIRSLGTKSVEKLEKLLDSDDPNVVFKTATFFLSRIPVQNQDLDDEPNWVEELKREAETIAEKELDQDFLEYGGYQNYLLLDKNLSGQHYQEIMKKKKELEKFYFEELKKEELADL